MAVINLTDASVTINSVDLSDHVQSVTLNYDADQVEVTSMGDTSHKFTGGLYNVSFDVTMFQDFAASEVEASVFDLVGTTTTVVIKPTSGAVAADNPSYTIADTFLSNHQPVAGSVGDMSMVSLSFVGGTMTKATS
jgi:hypothetical protein